MGIRVQMSKRSVYSLSSRGPAGKGASLVYLGYQIRPCRIQRSVVCEKFAIRIIRRSRKKERKRAFVGCPGLPLRVVGICDRKRSVLYNCVCVEVAKGNSESESVITSRKADAEDRVLSICLIPLVRS